MANIEIKTLSPVHVGSGRFLQSKVEYVFGKSKIGVVDEHKVLALIGEEQINSWVASIEKGNGLVSFLKGFGITPPLQKITSRTIALNCENERAKNLSTLKEQIHNGAGLPYIPGSSIKGAIRSAVFNQLLRERNHLIPDDKIELKGRISASVLEKEEFGRDPNHDIFRFLRVGDAYFNESATEALIFQNINIKKSRGEEYVLNDASKNQLVEAIGSGAVASFKISFDRTGMANNMQARQISEFPDCFSSINALFALINRNTRMILEEESEFWSEYYDDEVTEYVDKLKQILQALDACGERECIMRLAHGAGWTFITGNWPKMVDSIVSELVYEKIVDRSRPGNRARYSEFPFPKSRRITSDVELPGFIKLKILE